MFNIKENTIIYVGCPAYFKTGGTELAHQLVYELKSLGADSRILYYDFSDPEKAINPAFRIYVDSYETEDTIEDNEKNILIQPEVDPRYLNKFKNIQKAVWWMSVDNFVMTDGFNNYCSYHGFARAVKKVIQRKIHFLPYNFPDNITHFYQSEYAKEYLLNRGISNVYPLSDYINRIFFEEPLNLEKEDIVLYNPKKGYDFTKKIIEKSKNIKWVPIQNLTTEEVRVLLSKSKVYIDFGNHPGKDRFPREAAVSGCCIITGKRGSAAFFEDVTISDEFKFDDKLENIDKILTKIYDCLSDYETEYKKFSKYREKIKNEYAQFKQDVKNIIL